MDDVDTRYGRIFVIDSAHEADEAFIRTVRTDPFGVQCGAVIKNDKVLPGLVYPYTRAFNVVFQYVPEATRIAAIGCCNYSYPMHVSAARPTSHVDVIEIDEGMTAIAEKWFDFVPSERVRPIHADGRQFLAATEKKYDVIVLDAFSSPLMTPFQLLTVEAFTAMSSVLADEGAVVINLIGSVTGPGSEYVASVEKTLSRTFPTVHLYQIDTNEPGAIQNIIAVGSKKAVVLPTMILVPPQGDILTRYTPDPQRTDAALVLTDDYAPVERLTKPMRDFILYRQ